MQHYPPSPIGNRVNKNFGFRFRISDLKLSTVQLLKISQKLGAIFWGSSPRTKQHVALKKRRESTSILSIVYIVYIVSAFPFEYTHFTSFFYECLSIRKSYMDFQNLVKLFMRHLSRASSFVIAYTFPSPLLFSFAKPLAGQRRYWSTIFVSATLYTFILCLKWAIVSYSLPY